MLRLYAIGMICLMSANDDIRPANGQYLPPISESEKVVLRDAAIHDYLQEVRARRERDY